MSLILLFCWINIIYGFDFYQLWSIEQLDDMILSDAYKYDVPGRTPAIIAMYEKPCKSDVDQILFCDECQNLPNSMHLMIASFDRYHVKKEIWFEWNKNMDVFNRYNITTDNDNWCPTILYQPANWSLPVNVWDKNKYPKFIDWAWDMIKVEITFKNTLDKVVNIVVEMIDNNGIINEGILGTIEANGELKIELHASDVVSIKDADNNVVNRYIIDTIKLYIEIDSSDDENVLEYEKLTKNLNKEHELRIARDWSTRRRYLNNVRTPKVMPGFTKTGFLHKKMPDKICKYLKDFYNENKNHKLNEGFPKDGTQINTREIPTWMMHIPYQKKLWISKILQPDLEEWAKTKLQHTTIYGLREYTNGAVLKGHVDRIETHIVSAILHVNHEPRNVSWPLEVTGFDGKLYTIEDDECDLVYYESSKLIHGRPSTYKGTSWVNAFLHYRPVDWKGYEFTPDNVIKTPKSQTPLVDWKYG